MVKVVAGMIFMTAFLHPAVTYAVEADREARVSLKNSGEARGILCRDREVRGFEDAVTGVLKHFDAGNHEGLAREISAVISLESEITDIMGQLKQMAGKIDAGSSRRFRSIDMYAGVEGIKGEASGRFAMLSHFRTCSGNICEEQVVMKMVDDQWRLAGLYVLVQENTATSKTPD